MLKFLKNFFNLAKQNILLKAEIDVLKKKLGDPKIVIEKIFDKGIKWYDWNDLSIERRREYFRTAQMFLDSEIIHNIKNYLIATGTQTAFLEHEQNSNKIRDFQMSINGIELLMKELASIENPDKGEEKKDEIYNGT